MWPPWVSTSRIASSTAHSSCGLVVNARLRASIARASGVRVICAPGAGTRLTHARMRTPASALHARVVGIEERPRAGDDHAHRVVLVHVAHAEVGALDRVLRREGREKKELARRRAPAR